MKNSIAFIGDPHLSLNNPVNRIDNYFEASMKKLDEVMRNNEYIVDLGDLTNNPVLDTFATLKLANRLKKYKEDGGHFMSLIGNHNVYNWNTNTLNKTTLGLLNSLGLLEVLDTNAEGCIKNKIIDIDCKITPLPLNFNKNELPKADKEYRINILVGHAFYAYERDKKHSLDYEHLKDLGYDYIFFGHDHAYYKPLNIGDDSILYRPGSLTRTTKHSYNMTRKIVYYQYDIDNETVEEKTIKCAKPINEIFPQEVIDEKSDNSPEYLVDIEDLLDQLATRKVGTLSIRKMLEDNPEVPEEVFNFICWCHEECNLDFV